MEFFTAEFDEITTVDVKENEFDISNLELSEIGSNKMYSYNELLFNKLLSYKNTDMIKFFEYHLNKVKYKYFWIIQFEDMISIRTKTNNFVRNEILLNLINPFIEHFKMLKLLYKNIYIDEPIKTNSKFTQKVSESINSFTIYDDIRDPFNLAFFKNKLILNKLISSDTEFHQLNNIFRGKIVKEKIVWVGTKEELRFFVNCLMKHMKVHPLISFDKWKTTRLCFCDIDGDNNWINISNQSDPTNDKRRELIENLVKLLPSNPEKKI